MRSEEMELEEVKRDLRALRQLYGLLQNGHNVVRNASSESLGERARFMLKDLLDGAATRFFTAHAKILSADSSLSEKFCASKTEETSKAAPDKRVRNPRVASQRDDWPSTKLTTLVAVSKLCKHGNPLTKPEKRREQREVFSHRDTKQAPETRASNEKAMISKNTSARHEDYSQNLSIPELNDLQSEWKEGKAWPGRERDTTESHRSSSVASSFACSSSSTRTRAEVEYYLNGQRDKRKLHDADFSKEVSKSIRRIESHISALRSRCRTSERRGSSQTGRPSPCGNGVLGRQASHVTERHLPGFSRPLYQMPRQNSISRNGSLFPFVSSKEGLYRPENQMTEGGRVTRSIAGHNMSTLSRQPKAIVDITEQLSRSASRMTESPEFVRGFMVPLPQDHKPNRPLTSLTQESRVDNIVGLKESTTQSIPSHTRESTAPARRDRKQRAQREEDDNRNLQPKLGRKPAQKDYRSGDFKTASVRRKGRPAPLTNEQISESVGSRSASSSSWTTQESTTSSSPSEDYSCSSGHKGSTPERSVSLSRSVEESSRSDVSSSGESRSGPSTIESQSWSRDRRSRKDCAKTKRLKEAEKAVGRFRRLKNRLGLVFRHHHHHHHHLHHDQDESDLSGVEGNHPLPKEQRRKTSETRKNRKERAPASERKSVIKQRQFGNFHALAEGLLRHIWDSRKSKPSKDEIKRLGRGKRGAKKKATKTLHWWQRVRRHGGVQRPNKGRAKVGLANRKQIKHA